MQAKCLGCTKTHEGLYSLRPEKIILVPLATQPNLYRVVILCVYCMLWAYFNMFDVMSIMCLESQKIFKGPGGGDKERLVHLQQKHHLGAELEKENG